MSYKLWKGNNILEHYFWSSIFSPFKNVGVFVYTFWGHQIALLKSSPENLIHRLYIGQPVHEKVHIFFLRLHPSSSNQGMIHVNTNTILNTRDWKVGLTGLNATDDTRESRSRILGGGVQLAISHTRGKYWMSHIVYFLASSPPTIPCETIISITSSPRHLLAVSCMLTSGDHMAQAVRGATFVDSIIWRVISARVSVPW